MTITFDQHAINHLTVAVAREMTPQGAKRHPDSDTLFMGGAQPTEAEQRRLASFGLSKNYKIVFPSFDPIDVAAGPTAFHVVVTDGLQEAFTLSEGRLWKRDRRSAAVLLFPQLDMLIKLSSKGRLIVRAMAGRYHDHGYEFARESVLARASRKPGHAPVLAQVGGLMTVLDMKTFAETFAAGE